jgi:hypothetical protein
MSEIGWYKSLIRLAKVKAYSSNIEANPSFQLLKRSLEIVAQEHSGTLTNYVIDSLGRKTTCDLAITTADFSRGVGINIDKNTGEVTFLYDQYGGYGQLARKITEEITQNYVAIALIRGMKALGYKVKEEVSKQRETVVLVGRV